MVITHLVATDAWTEALVGKVEFLDTKRAGLLLIVVDELVLLRPRHDVSEPRRVGDGRRGEGARRGALQANGTESAAPE